MINPIGGGSLDSQYGGIRKNKKLSNPLNSTEKNTDGVIVEIKQNKIDEEERLEERVKKIKKLIKEGKYPLNYAKLAEKILDFFTDGG